MGKKPLDSLGTNEEDRPTHARKPTVPNGRIYRIPSRSSGRGIKGYFRPFLAFRFTGRSGAGSSPPQITVGA